MSMNPMIEIIENEDGSITTREPATADLYLFGTIRIPEKVARIIAFIGDAKPGELLHIANRRIITCDRFFIDLDNDLQQLSRSQIATMLFLNDTPSTNLKKLFS